jgi:4-carboxymuconolactone decarboxylase
MHLRPHYVIFFKARGNLMDDEQRREQGTRVRRAILGNQHVDRAVVSTTEFTADFQDFITRVAWGDIWSRPGLPAKTRSLLTIALMVALNRADEFRMHVRAALNNGITQDEIKEILLHCAIYCGVPAANSAFHIALEVLAEGDNKSPSDSKK